MPSPGDHLDGYTLTRRIGQGGFGEVWLCRSDSMGDWRALKFIPTGNGRALDKEYAALVRYRKAAGQLRSPHLTPIEHVNRCESGLYYVMPMADGDGANSPESPEWHPRTRRSVLDAKRKAPAWFTSAEVTALMKPVLVGLQCLADAGLVHRDIKPDNILFFGGKPCLADISLMTDDRTRITRHGTPGYCSPSWYVGGHHDMYGAAATLYTLLTGNEPDRMGRAAFVWPPQGEASLSPGERSEWLRLHAVIRRATDESPAERFPDVPAVAHALNGIRISDTPVVSAPKRRGVSWKHAGAALLGLIGFASLARQGDLLSGKHPEAGKPIGEHDSLMKRLEPFLAENDRIGREYDRKLTELLAFYETNAPSVISELEALSEEPLSPENFESRLTAAAVKLKSLIRPEFSLRDDPLVELPKEEWLRRIKAAKKAKEDGQPEALSTLADARIEAQILWANVFEAAGQCPQNPDEQFWFEKRVSARFYASPLRITRDMPPMETLWFVKADNDGVMRPLSEGRLKTLVAQLALRIKGKDGNPAWTPALAHRCALRLDEMRKAALWVEIQTGVFMKREK